jgi:hypothetical protein
MEIYILILVMIQSSTPSVHSTEFNSEHACTVAKSIVEDHYSYMRAICVAKGE